MARPKKITEPAAEPVMERLPVIHVRDEAEEAVSTDTELNSAQPEPMTVHEKRDLLQAQINDLERYQSEMQREQEALTRKLNQANHMIAELEPQQPIADAIRQYIDGQNLTRAERFARRKELLDMGAEREELVTAKSPLDQALAKKKTSARPSRGV